MRLHAICYYRSKSDTWTDGWRDVDYKARNLVKAVKQVEFRGSSTFRVNGRDCRVEHSTAGQKMALYLAAGSIGQKIKEAGYDAASVVPVPSSAHTDPNSSFTGRRLADEIERLHPTLKSSPILYFAQEMAKSSSGGGTRNAATIQENLRAAECGIDGPVVLIDDVCTSGGHLKAAARFLQGMGITVEDAFVVGRTAWEKPEQMFQVPVEELQVQGLFDLDW